MSQLLAEFGMKLRQLVSDSRENKLVIAAFRVVPGGKETRCENTRFAELLGYRVGNGRFPCAGGAIQPEYRRARDFSLSMSDDQNATDQLILTIPLLDGVDDTDSGAFSDGGAISVVKSRFICLVQMEI